MQDTNVMLNVEKFIDLPMNVGKIILKHVPGVSRNTIIIFLLIIYG